MVWLTVPGLLLVVLWAWLVNRANNKLRDELFELQTEYRLQAAQLVTANHNKDYFKQRALDIVEEMRQLRASTREAILELEKHSPADAGRLVRDRFRKLLSDSGPGPAGTGSVQD